MRKTVLTMVFLTLITSCKNSKSEVPQDQDLLIKNGQVTVPENNPIFKKIKTQIVTEQEHSDGVVSAGTIQAIPNHYAEIASPFSGRITQSFIQLGQNISAGSPLFEILSSDYFSVQKDYTDALNDVQLAEKNYRRQQDLVKHGVGIQKELDEAETDFKNKKTSLSNASSALKVYNSKGGGLGSPLVVRAPINGEIISNKIVNGQYLKGDADPVMIIAELSKVWISGDVKEKDIRFVNTGDQVSVKVSAYPDRNITGKVYHINEIVDEDTRSIKVLIECDNPDRKLKPGMYATVSFSTTPEKTVMIPITALMQQDDSQYVWVKTGKSQYAKRPVTTGETDQKTVRITSGIKLGETIMTEGGIYMLDAK
ncbi:cobalt-zinc-cadmium efflux system membrane fusion protein [Chryseobacterium bernardetii]|uniref:Cobalt-zinc-cadmium efflux system membrane fusion protein n=2 Tax=Chryseobacterium TaxID=59732 RepID=A0A543EN71_9FLAO|nr:MULTISPECIES: efflux RND transporter periplasmic adaptor subunit [Chryseobacterium]MDR6369422.1 cobalt-zinc-cadmium efflux system membrane fusion protein [Chryseobacterium vietnamense]MDR6439656.1 cobalt-zinc-cadmium efflux system membrane fusion protein [Chryseobacterium bernardetii]TQM23030.1 cobalt-zinc-cadmium efflux system membrane fusion protein [Chryseobacterium aquifrigidense]